MVWPDLFYSINKNFDCLIISLDQSLQEKRRIVMKDYCFVFAKEMQ